MSAVFITLLLLQPHSMVNKVNKINSTLLCMYLGAHAFDTHVNGVTAEFFCELLLRELSTT